VKVLLVNPPYLQHIYGTTGHFAVHQPLGLAYLAAYLEARGVEVSILDANALMLTLEETARQVKGSRADLVGLTAVTNTITLVYELARLIKRDSPQKIIVAGGPHPSVMDRRTLEECQEIDVVVRGEGEETLRELVEVLGRGGGLEEVAGVTFRHNGSLCATGEREPIADIDTLPYPARHLLPLEVYRPGPFLNRGVKGERYARLLTTRGCPHHCTYCAAPLLWPRVRMHSAEYLVGEMKHLVRTYGVGHIDVLDDTFTASRRRLRRTCELIGEEGLEVAWTCYAGVRSLARAPELIEAMKQAGCFGLELGIESGDEEVLARIRKDMTLDEARAVAAELRRQRMRWLGFFMLGLPGETRASAERTIELAVELDPDIAFFSITTPFPGTELYAEMSRRGLITEGLGWDDMTLHGKTLMCTEHLSAEEVRALYESAVRAFYLRPGYAWKTLRHVLRSPREIRNYARLAKEFLNL